MAGCSSQNNNSNYKLTTTVDAEQNGSRAYIINYDSGEPVDSTDVTDGTITFSGSVEKPIMARLIIGGNRGPLFVVTENGLKGYQSNNLYNQTDPDLGPWGKDGEYGMSTISPFTFDHVARDLYPANNYFGLSGLIPTTIEHGVDYVGSVTMNAKTDLRHVKDIANCAVTAMLIDLNTGAMVNAAHAPIAVETAVKPAVADGNEPEVGVSGGNLRVKAQGTFSVSVAGVDGRCVGTARAHGEVELPLPAQGAYIVTVTTDHGQFTEKVLHTGK